MGSREARGTGGRRCRPGPTLNRPTFGRTETFDRPKVGREREQDTPEAERGDRHRCHPAPLDANADRLASIAEFGFALFLKRPHPFLGFRRAVKQADRL